MRPYVNITDAELEAHGALRSWEPESLDSLRVPAKALWVHAARDKNAASADKIHELVKTVTILDVDEELIRTDFGTYSVKTGKNVFDSCGSKQFCSCYGQLYLFRESHALPH